MVGPGHYDHEKKKDDLRNKVIAEEAVHPAFSSTQLREFQKKTKTVAPGPGTYIDINNPLHCSFRTQVANLNREERHQQEEQGIKLGPFGANKDRFFKSWLDPKAGPDPGQYNKPLVRVEKQGKNKYDLAMEGRSQASTRALTAAEKERTKMNSVFCSNTERFKQTPDLSLEVKGFDPNKTATVFKSQGNVLTAKDIV